jgi:hypothetical protein
VELSSAPFGIFVSDAPEPLNSVALTVPTTSSFSVGVAVPMPTLPLPSIKTARVLLESVAAASKFA